MIAARLRLEDGGNGKKYLTGRLSYALERGTLLVLRKNSDGGYELVNICGDGRQVNGGGEQSVLSFCQATDAEERAALERIAAQLTQTEQRSK